MTYWIYLTITVFIVATPGIVRNVIIPVNIDPTVLEMILLLVLGCLALIIHYFKEHALNEFLRQSIRCRRELRDISKDLSSSYTYIGEINRKIEILTELASKMPDETKLHTKEMQDIEHSILKAVESFSDCKNFCLGIYDGSDNRVAAMVYNVEKLKLPLPNRAFFENEEIYSMTEDDLYYIRTSRNDTEMIAFATVQKSTLRSANIELIKTALQKLLFLRTYKQRQTQEVNSALALD